MPLKDGKRLKDKVLESAETVEEAQADTDEWEAVRIVRPNAHRDVAHYNYNRF